MRSSLQIQSPVSLFTSLNTLVGLPVQMHTMDIPQPTKSTQATIGCPTVTNIGG